MSVRVDNSYMYKYLEEQHQRDAAKTAQSPLHLEAMLEALLPQEVAKRMGQGGALNYKTGRFAESVEPTLKAMKDF